MIETSITLQDIAALSALANGVIPPDARDTGAASVHAGPSIAGRVRYSPYADVYVDGLKVAKELAQSKFNGGLDELDAEQMQALLGDLSEQSPQFFRQLRADVCLFYLSDPGVWQRIGVPGESTELGGYPDFDQPQH
jgi:hypothetical protein